MSPDATPSTGEIERRASVAERAARAGATVAEAGFRGGLTVEQKQGKTDVVTQADRDAQNRVIEVVRETYPEDAIVGEEEDELKAIPESGAAWVIDPIDGTNNYVRGVGVWATSVAAVVDGEPVAAANVLPVFDDVFVSDASGVTRNGDPVAVSEEADPDAFVVVPTFWWNRDQRDAYANANEAIVSRFGDMRRYGSAQVVLSLLASGGVEGVVTNLTPNPWDTVAGVHMVRQAGGTVTDLAGDRWRHDSEGLVASNDTNHDLVLDAARDI